MVQIIPTLFSTTEEEYRNRLSRLTSSSFLKDGWVQLDLMDNKFVPKQGISLEVVRRYPNPFYKEAQLMVIDPGEWIGGLIDLKVNRIVFPVEIKGDILMFINQIKKAGIEVGLSVNPDTKLEKVYPYINSLDGILLMGVNPGLEGQKLDLEVNEKIKEIKLKNPNIKVGIDGGVNDTNVKELVKAGADYLAIGSYLFTGDIDENLENLWEAING